MIRAVSDLLIWIPGQSGKTLAYLHVKSVFFTSSFFFFLVLSIVFQSNGPRLHEVFPEHNFTLTCVLK